jgi:hypothetical protein
MNVDRIGGFLGVPVGDRRRDYTDVMVTRLFVATLSSGHRIILEPGKTLAMEGDLASRLMAEGYVEIFPPGCNRGGRRQE